MRTVLISLLGLFSHNVIAHQGSILASGHIEVLAFALMALGILLATIAAALDRIYPRNGEPKDSKAVSIKNHQYSVPTLNYNNFAEDKS